MEATSPCLRVSCGDWLSHVYKEMLAWMLPSGQESPVGKTAMPHSQISPAEGSRKILEEYHIDEDVGFALPHPLVREVKIYFVLIICLDR